jgi:hypothetical protein
MEGNRIRKRVLYMNLESTRPRGRPRNRWQDEMREDVIIVGGEEWQEKVYNREEWKKLLRAAGNCHIVHMAMGINKCMYVCMYSTCYTCSLHISISIKCHRNVSSGK